MSLAYAWSVLVNSSIEINYALHCTKMDISLEGRVKGGGGDSFRLYDKSAFPVTLNEVL